MNNDNTDPKITEKSLNKKPKTIGLELFFLMISGNIKLPAKGRKYIFYMYLMLFGSCTREMVPLLLNAADKVISNRSQLYTLTYDNAGIGSKAVDDFISYRLRKGSIIKTVKRGRILYSLSSAGYRELSVFLSSPCIMSFFDMPNAAWHSEDTFKTVKNHSVHSSTVGIAFLHMAEKCRFGVGDFALNTPIDSHGILRKETFDQSLNRCRSDARLLINSPCRLDFFFRKRYGDGENGCCRD